MDAILSEQAIYARVREGQRRKAVAARLRIYVARSQLARDARAPEAEIPSYVPHETGITCKDRNGVTLPWVSIQFGGQG